MNGTNHLQIVLNANSVNMFKNKVDIYLRRAGYEQMNENMLDSR